MIYVKSYHKDYIKLKKRKSIKFFKIYNIQFLRNKYVFTKNYNFTMFFHANNYIILPTESALQGISYF